MSDVDPSFLIPRWYVVFSGAAKREHLVDWLSPKAFLHCFAFAYDGNGERWMIYDVSRKGTSIVALTGVQFNLWITYMRREGARVLEVNTEPAERFWLQVGLWCVVSIRHLVGSRSRALRPIGLWRDLRRAGAKEAFV